MSTSIEGVAQRWLSTFQQDLKDFLNVVCDDPELDDPLREAAVGAVLYALAPGDVVPDSAGPVPLGYLDDAMVLRVVLGEVAAKQPARFEEYRDRIPEMTSDIEDDLAALQEFLGDLYEPFRARVMDPSRLEFRGKRVRDAINDPEWLSDEVAVVALKLDFKPNDVLAASKRASSILTTFRSKLAPRK